MRCNLCGNSNERKYTVYMHISPSNKKYIGITCKVLKKRWQCGNGYKHNEHFYRAIQKYGWDNFEHVILFENLTEHEAKLMERFYIAYYDTFNQDKGYNLTLGGDGTEGRTIPNEVKEKLRNNAKGKRGIINVTTGEKFISINDAARKEEKISNTKFRQAVKSISRCCNGYSKTYHECDWWFINEYENNLEKGSLEYKIPSKVTDRKIICITTNEIFENAVIAGDKYKINKYGIIKACKNIYFGSGKLDDGTMLTWMFKDDYDKYKKNGTLKQEILKRSYRSKDYYNKKIICLNTNNTFNNIIEASIFYDIKPEYIRNCCDNKQVSTLNNSGENLFWIYEKDNNKENKHVTSKIDIMNKKELNKGSIICLNTKEEYEDLEHAAKTYNINKQYILNVCNGKTKSTIINGKKFIFMFKDDYIKLTNEEINSILDEIKPKVKEIVHKEKRDKRVICTTTMEVFDDVKQAGEKYNVHFSNISKCCSCMSGNSKSKKIVKHAGYLNDGTQLVWQYYRDYLENGEKTPEPRIIHGKNKRKVICLDTGEIYESITQASRETGINLRSIHSNVSGKLKSIKGTHWKYLDEVI